MRQGKFGDIAPIGQLAGKPRLWPLHADGDECGFGGFVAADLAVFAQHAPLAAVSDDTEEAGFRGVDVLRQHRIRRF